MKKIEGLDTLRFFSFFAIFVFHATPYFRYGYLGVDFFFVLSSFLLTYLSLKEIETTGSFSRMNFFVRRALRIFPLYYLIVCISFLLLPFIGPYLGLSPTLPKNKLFYWFFLSNYETSDCIFYLKFLWSIAVEEQFYLLFIMMSFLLDKKTLLFVFILLLSYFVFMVYALNNNISTYTNLLTHFPNFSLGMLSAYLYHKKTDLQFYPVISLVLSFIGFLTINNEIVLNVNISIFFASLILLTIKHAGKLKKLGMFKLTEKLGMYTYGLYVYSGVVFTFVSKSLSLDNLFIKVVLEFFILLILAFLSYHIYEKQFLKLKKHFR